MIYLDINSNDLKRDSHFLKKECKINDYLNQNDWRVNENSNMNYSLQGLNHYIHGNIIKDYWLDNIYTQTIKDLHNKGFIHLHDLTFLASYCLGWDLYDLLLKGLGGVNGKVSSNPPKHFATALLQASNFLFITQGESAGAQAFSSFDVLLAPFIRYDKLNYEQVKQYLQQFIFNMNMGMRTGAQAPFTNITLDLKASESAYADISVIIGGISQDETYSEFQEEVNMFNRALFEIFLEGDGDNRIFSFPIPTINITKDFDWNNPTLENLWKATAKYGIPYFSNFINSNMSPTDVRSMCCRLRLDTSELEYRGGGLFGANPKTGSIGIVSINMPRIAMVSTSEKEFFKKLDYLMTESKNSLEIKRNVVEQLMEKGLYPYSKVYLDDVKKSKGKYFANHFSTIGLVGMNEACEIFLNKDIGSKEGQEFAKKVLLFMREKLKEFQQETGNLYNLEATPAESTSYRFARLDKKLGYSEYDYIYYTNSTQLPVNYTSNILEVLDKQDDLQTLYTGGTVLHLFLGEELHDIETVKQLIKGVFEQYKLPYISITPTFSICPTHGYISGKVYKCPKCNVNTEVYSRIVGYYRPVQDWNKGKKQEFKERVVYEVDENEIKK